MDDLNCDCKVLHLMFGLQHLCWKTINMGCGLYIQQTQCDCCLPFRNPLAANIHVVFNTCLCTIYFFYKAKHMPHISQTCFPFHFLTSHQCLTPKCDHCQSHNWKIHNCCKPGSTDLPDQLCGPSGPRHVWPKSWQTNSLNLDRLLLRVTYDLWSKKCNL